MAQNVTRNPGTRIYAASKIPPANDRWPALPEYKYSEVFSAEHVFKYADMIRKQLRVDTIDLLQFHVWDDSWTGEAEFRSTVEKLKRDKWIRFFGLSINRWQPENGIKALHTGLVDVVQVIYNIFDQAPEDELFPVCQELNVGVIARVPLDEGSLGGKMTLGDAISEGRLARGIFWSRESGEDDQARRQVERNSSGGYGTAGNGDALHSVASCGEHDDCGHAQARTRAPEHRRK